MRHSVLFATAFATLISTQTFAADLPGKGITVNPVQSTITEETFQTLLVSRAHHRRQSVQQPVYPRRLRIVQHCPPLAWYPTDYFDQPLFTPSRSKARSSIPFEMMPTYCWSSSTTGTAQGACPT